MQRMFKKGDLSMSTIVMAVIAVLIMVILIALVTGNLGRTSGVINSCEDQGGRCSFSACSEEEFVGYGLENRVLSCTDNEGRVDTEQRCCIQGRR